MASTGCWKCLIRPSISPNSYALTNIRSRLPLVAAFSTSSSLAASPLKKKTPTGKLKALTPKLRQANSLRIKKKAFVKTGKPPMPGERKALRKRIVLSNTNAFEVSDMKDMTTLLDSSQIGTVVGLPGPIVDQLRTVEAFKKTQGWGMFRRPGCLVRKESIELVKLLEEAEAGKKTTMTIIDGKRGAGKSMILLQAMATAFLKGWVVINVPDGEYITAARTDYTPIPDTNPIQYSQNTYIASLLSQISKANESILSKLTLSKSYPELPIPIQGNISLSRLADLGARDPEIAHPIFLALWSELTAPGLPPILFALDGLSHIMQSSAYRAPDFTAIHAHDLALVQLFVEHLSGRKTLPNGGCILAAMNRTSDPKPAAVDMVFKQKEEIRNGQEMSKLDPFTKYDMRAYESLQAASVMELKGLGKDEARGLMEYWAASGVLRARVDEKTVTESWALAGNGIVGEIERGALRMRI